MEQQRGHVQRHGAFSSIVDDDVIVASLDNFDFDTVDFDNVDFDTFDFDNVDFDNYFDNVDLNHVDLNHVDDGAPTSGPFLHPPARLGTTE